MDDITRNRVFRPYAQASASTARRFGGTGLGLSICRQLVELMRGTLDMQSAPGTGTTIAISLPCALQADDGRNRLKLLLKPDKQEADTPLQGDVRSEEHRVGKECGRTGAN